jgi:hypothetical protein
MSNAPRKPRRKLNWWLAQVLEAYYAARDLWLAAREYVTNGFTAEQAEYAERNPRPLFKDFLIASRIY